MRRIFGAAFAVLAVFLCLTLDAHAQKRITGQPGDPPDNISAAQLAAIPCNAQSTAGTRYVVTSAASNSCTTAGALTNVCRCDGSTWSVEGTGGGSSAFSAITSGTSTTAAMVVGSGATLAASGSGRVTATDVSTIAASVVNITAPSTFSLPAAATASRSLGVSTTGFFGGVGTALDGPVVSIWGTDSGDVAQQHVVPSIGVDRLPADAFGSWLPYVDADQTVYAMGLATLPTADTIVQRDSNGDVVSAHALVPEFTTATPPATPASGYGSLWRDGDGVGGFVHLRDDGGTDHELVEKSASTALGIPYWTAAGTLSYAPGWTADASSGVLTGPGVYVSQSTTSSVNGLDVPQNQRPSGGSVQSCASVGFHGNGTSAGSGRIGLGDLDSRASGTGANFPELCADNAPAPIPVRSRFLTSGAAMSNVDGCVSFGNGTTVATTNFGAASQLYGALWFDPLRTLRFRSLTLAITTFGTGAAWDSNEKISFLVYRCAADSSATSADCSQVDQIVFQASASPSATYGVGGTARTAAACATFPCVATIPLDGQGLSSAGVPYVAVGGSNRDYGMLCWDTAFTDTTWDDDTDTSTLSIAGHLEVWN